MVIDDLELFDEPEPVFDRTREWAVREVTPVTTRRWVKDWHYSHRYPGGGTVGYGVFAPDMIALVTVSMATNAAGVAKRLGLELHPGNMEISRVVAHPSAPKNTASRAIAACYPIWRARGWEWLFSYADTGQNHHGGIYQALNAIYCGLSPARDGYLVNGEPMHPRSVVARYGTRAWPRVVDVAASQGDVIERVDDMNTPKHTYILPIGAPASRRAIRAALAPFAKPYPKREPSTQLGVT